MRKGPLLRNILRKVEFVHMQNPITPARRDGYAKRERKNEEGIIRDKNRQILGDYYEFMTAGLYGGEIRKNVEVAPRIFIEPDVLNETTRQGFECKAVSTGESLKLDDHQIVKYHKLQLHMQDYDFHFAVYRHPITGLNDYESETFFQDISDKTLCSILLPLSLVTHIHSVRDNDLVYRYEGEKWCHTTTIRSHILNRFFGDVKPRSEQEVVKALGANPADYEFQRLMSPMDFRIQRRKVKGFPIMFISDKSHGKWMDWFLENVQIQEELPFSDKGDEEIPF